MKKAGVVVLYNPDTNVLDNIQTYSSFVERLYVIDNSEQRSEIFVSALQRNIKHAAYVGLGQNVGIARALNIAAKQAHQDGFKWLLMMDQDSSFSGQMIERFMSLAESINERSTGILAPRYLHDPTTLPTSQIEEVYSVITSGSLLNLRAYSEVGPFRDELFIDFVDHEYCLRLQQHNFKILVASNVQMNHQLGNLSCHNFFGKRLCTSNHNYLRRYYITRNRLEIMRQFQDHFPEFLADEKNKNFIEIIKVLLFETDKFRKVKSFLLGYLDFKRKKFGKYSYE